MKTGCVVWFTGLSGSGKSTLARAVAARLAASGYPVEILDADVIRSSLSVDLGFSREDRGENIRRIAAVANRYAEAGNLVLVAAIAPYRSMRENVRAGCALYFEVYVNAPLAVCEQRDPKGLYRRARAGDLKQLTGIDDPYEPPDSPDVECRTDHNTVEECTTEVLQALTSFLSQHQNQP